MGYYSGTEKQIAIASDVIYRNETNLSSSVTGVGSQVCIHSYDSKHKISFSNNTTGSPEIWAAKCTGDPEYDDEYECIRRCDLFTYHDIWVCCINNFACTYPTWSTSPGSRIAQYTVDGFIRKIRFTVQLLKIIVKSPDSYEMDPPYISNLYFESDRNTSGEIGTTKVFTIYTSQVAATMANSQYNSLYPGVFIENQGYCGGSYGVHSVFIFGNNPYNNSPTEYYIVGVHPLEFWVSPNAGIVDNAYNFSSISSLSDLKATHTELYINTDVFKSQTVRYSGGVIYNGSLLPEGTIYCPWLGTNNNMKMHFCKDANLSSELFMAPVSYYSNGSQNFKKLN